VTLPFIILAVDPYQSIKKSIKGIHFLIKYALFFTIKEREKSILV